MTLISTIRPVCLWIGKCLHLFYMDLTSELLLANCFIQFDKVILVKILFYKVSHFALIYCDH